MPAKPSAASEAEAQEGSIRTFLSLSPITAFVMGAVASNYVQDKNCSGFLFSFGERGVVEEAQEAAIPTKTGEFRCVGLSSHQHEISQTCGLPNRCF